MALRKVFSQDDDFKESMFARQIAVMKGQAWNVVETLKQPDHGPLELTRRTRVCVWDDLVDVPVAIPLRVPSTDVQKRVRHYDDDEEEVDIGAAASSRSGLDADLLGLGSSVSEFPASKKFELSRRGQPSGEAGPFADTRSVHYPDEIDRGSLDGVVSGRDVDPGWSSFPPPRTAHSLADHNGHRKLSSVSSGRGVLWDGDDEGDLGYAAAQGMEGNQRKVIVERIEAVKSKNPVFTWC